MDSYPPRRNGKTLLTAVQVGIDLNSGKEVIMPLKSWQRALPFMYEQGLITKEQYSNMYQKLKAAGKEPVTTREIVSMSYGKRINQAITDSFHDYPR